MRPQDIVILLKIVSLGERNWFLKDLSNQLYISYSEVSESLERSVFANLIDYKKQNVNRGNLLDFLIYGLKYVFPAQAGILTKGIPTAHSHPFMKKYISSKHAYVWPSSSGGIIGQAIEPLYLNQVLAVQEDGELYKLLALSDVIRVGKLREVAIAEKELKESIDYVPSL